ncbi:hypothetical protein ACF0H5_011888 [Mactra antiquata]
MASHICNSSKKISWDKIKLAITGRKKKSDSFICGGCSRTFATICFLHTHCMRHNEGGSYYFDHVTNTAFPKHDTICSSTQHDGDGCFDAVCDTDKIIPCVPRSICENIEDTSKQFHDHSTIDNKCINDEPSDREPFKSNNFDDNDVNTETDVSLVQVRNLTKLEDGSVFFEMDEKGALLLDRTAPNIVKEMHNVGDKLMEKSNELKVTDGQTSHSSQVKETTSLVERSETSYSELLVAQVKLQNDKEVNQDEQTMANTNDIKGPSDLQTCDMNKESQSVSVQDSVSTTEKSSNNTDDGSVIANIEKKYKNSDSATNHSNNTNDTDACETGMESPVLVRSTRKRKLTLKMKESVLAKSLFAVPDTSKSEYHPDKKKRKTNISQDTRKSSKSLEADIYASEALLSLSATNDSTEKEITKKSEVNSKIGVSDDKNSAGHSKVIDTDDRMVEKIYDDTKVSDNDGKNKFEFTITADYKDLNTEGKEFDIDNRDDENDNEDNNNGDNEDDDFVPKMPRQMSGGLAKRRKQDLECKTCGKVVPSAMIKSHKKMHLSEKKFTCKECGKTLKSAACLRSHMKTHGEKEWKCDLCPAAFFRKAYLETHKTNHTGIYPYVCDLCGMKFKMTYILQRHINCVHKNIRRYKCDICQQGFFRAATRDQHRVRHFDPSLKCSYCPKMFKADLDLRKHELTHTGEKLFFCPLCNHGFSQIWPYYKHMWAIHQIQKEEAKKMKINNPDMKNMKKTNRNSNFLDHSLSGTNIPRTHFSSNNYLKPNFNGDGSVDESHARSNCSNVLTSEIEDSNFDPEKNETEVTSMILSASQVDTCITDTIVLDIGQTIDVNNTIVVHSEDIHTVDNSTGFIVVDDGQGDGNIVVLSEFHDSEIEHIVNECATSSL